MTPKASLIGLGLPLLLLVTGGARAHAEAPAGWSIVESSGAVSLFVKGRPGPATTGEAIPADAAVLTGGNGRAVLARGADRVELSANGRLRLSTASGLFADRGRISFAFAAPGDAGVATPFLRASGVGSNFSITVTSGGASVQPGAGSVDVATLGGEARRRLTPGMIAIVGADRLDQLVIDGTARQLIGAPAPAAVSPTAAVRRADGSVEIAALH